MLYCEGSNDNDIFDVARSVSKPSRDARMQQSNFYMLSIAMMMATAYLFMSYCKEQQQQKMVDCNEGTGAKQQPTKPYVASRKRATIAEQHHCWHNDYVLRCVA